MTKDELLARFVPFSTLKYSTEAFIDYRIPGCAPKKNYAMIGPGVSQNPNQPVSLREKHGFQVGGVAMPPGKINPPHMHFTAEVFICTQGDWELHWGFNPDVSKAPIGPGDIASIPTWIYRGFQNVGSDEGFMFTALGGNDTGGILWGPQTLQAAQEQGVHLTEDYQIVDEQSGQKWDDSTMRRLQPMTQAEILRLRQWAPSQMQKRLVAYQDLDWSAMALLDASLPGCGTQVAPAIGLGMSEDRNHLAPINNSHGFSLEWLKIPVGGKMSSHRLQSKSVLSVYKGAVRVLIRDDAGDDVQISATGGDQGWDMYAMPADAWHSFHNDGDTDAVLLVMLPGDARKPIEWATDVCAQAAQAGFAIDANGYVALKCYTDRSQR